MSVLTEFTNTQPAWNEIRANRPWSLLLYGSAQSKKEDRCRVVVQNLPQITSIGINRIEKNHFSFQIDHQRQRHACTHVSALRASLTQKIDSRYQDILLDLTSLELDLILYILPLLVDKKPVSLFGIYLVPDSYGDKHQDHLELLEIRQPYGYVSLLPGISGIRDAAHYVILGFDKGRAERFFEQYDWDWAQVHSVTGDPAYVAGGAKKAEEVNGTWLKHLKPNNQHKLAANDPFATRDFFREQLRQHRMLDIVPLGPKPMLLGILLFYLQLSEQDRSRVRFLYDFPIPRRGSTQGLARGFLYDCGELLNHE